ncbi:DNA helicase [Pseudooceanicola sp. LIPI14-2-Ac024]|uniref:DNA helicase n=1 Tax=Pseudooceanicola sp. LIPI14-2-Ac024 TaxID=3344875 RepID=UPI0035D01290
MRLSAPIYQLKRRAKTLARTETIPLAQALDRVARKEGVASWSLLAARADSTAPARPLLGRLRDGDMLLIGARPSQGKTRLALDLLLAAAAAGRRAVFFTLEYTEAEAMARLDTLAPDATAPRPEVVTSDEIDADYIIRRLAGAPRGSVAVIDYLQLLDQRRSTPPLGAQMAALRDFARNSGVILGFISQIDRRFDPAERAVPGIADLRLPNPVPEGVFTMACFLHAGAERVGPPR